MEAGDGLMFNEYLLDLDSSLGSDTIYEESVSRDVDSVQKMKLNNSYIQSWHCFFF